MGRDKQEDTEMRKGEKRGGDGEAWSLGWGQATVHEAELKRTLQSKRPPARPRE